MLERLWVNVMKILEFRSTFTSEKFWLTGAVISTVLIGILTDALVPVILAVAVLWHIHNRDDNW